jgi:hypothetical protein
VNRLRPAPIRGSSVKRTNQAPVSRVALSSADPVVSYAPTAGEMSRKIHRISSRYPDAATPASEATNVALIPAG